MRFYEDRFDEIFDMIRNDYKSLKGKSIDEAHEVLSEKYERFEFNGRAIKQCSTYYFGCYMWGLIDLNHGKERVFAAISDSLLFVKLYNDVAEEKHRFI